jgi:HEPN domain-containing protein
VDERTRKWFSAYVGDLRDTADRDYITARIANRLGLYQTSAWSGLRALEKYLKAILLYSCRSVKRYRSHNLPELLKEVEQLPVISFTLPAESRKFLVYLNDQGANRYSDVPIYVEGPELFKLDRLVWHVRRYCQDFLLLPGDASRYPGESEKRLAAIPGERASATLRIIAVPRGFLERVLDDGKSPLRPHLVWKNRYYGVRKKGAIPYRPTMAFVRPAHVMRPEILLPVLESLVFFPKDVLAALRNLKAERERHGEIDD